MKDRGDRPSLRPPDDLPAAFGPMEALLIIVGWIASALGCGVLAERKGMEPWGNGFIPGLLLGPLWLLWLYAVED